jgi:peptidyl-prolyl cis-trans isomerase SurA
MKMKKSTALIPLLLLSFLGFKAWSQEQVIDEVVAVVGANYILQSDIESQYIQFRMQGGITDARATRCQILEDLLFQKLMLNQAELDSIQVTEEQIEQTMDARFRYYIQQFGSQEKSLIEIKEEFRTLVKDQLMVDEAQQNIIKDLKVTPSEVRSFFNNLPKDSIPMIEMEYEIGQIVKEPSINKDELDATKARLKSLRDRILNGESFNTLAVLYSEDPGSAKKSGEVGFVSRGQLYPEYEAAAFGLKKGEVSEIIKSKAGYHIIQLIERRGEQINTRHILLIPKVSDADIQKASKLLDSIADLIREKKMTFEEAALQFSDDPGKINGASMVNPTTGNTRFVAGQIDPKVFFSIEKLNPGEISRPVVKVNEEEKKTVSLFYLKSRTEPHRANLKDDYSTIMEWAMNKKRGEVLNKWIADKISKTYFRINESYLDCNFQHSWEVKQY